MGSNEGQDERALAVEAPHPGDAADSPAAFAANEITFLHAYVRNGGNPFEALREAGYHPGSRDSAYPMADAIMRRLDALSDPKRALELAGMGMTSWLQCLYELATCNQLRVRAVALKMWGLALGVFEEGPTGAGARIIVEAASHDGQAGTRVTVETRSTPQKGIAPASGALRFPVAHPATRRPRPSVIGPTDDGEVFPPS